MASHEINELSLVFVNPWSICNKTTTIHDFIVDHHPDVLCIAETWLTGTESDNALISAVLPPGYAMMHAPRGSRGGGVAIIYRACISLRKNTLMSVFQTFELLDCLAMVSRPLRICTVYRSPRNHGHTMSEFFDEFSVLLESIATQPGHVVLVGDLNFHVDVPNDRDANELKSKLFSYGLQQHVSGATHRNGHTLDLVISREDDELVSSAVALDLAFRDHFPIFIKTKALKQQAPRKTVSYRKTKNVSKETLTTALSQTTLFDQGNIATLPELVQRYDSNLSEALDKVAPLHTRTIVHRTQSEWYNDEIRVEKQKRRRAERRWRKSGLQIHRNLYVQQKENVDRLIETAKVAYYRSLISSCESSKKLYEITGKLLGLKSPVLYPSNRTNSELVEEFNDFFVEKIVRIRNGIIPCPDPTPPMPQVHTCMESFELVTELQISKLIAASPNKTSELDPMPTQMVKMCADELCPVITRIVNASLTEGLFPEAYKDSTLRPLLKKTGLDADELNNYRPIANLTFVSKLLEKVVASQLMSYLTGNNLTDIHQSAYKANHSTETALLHVHDAMIRAIGEGNAVLFIMIDLSAAFDTVDLDILLCTLDSLGVKGKAAAWLCSYLEHRRQHVVIGDAKSNPLTSKYGVPQGSVLGPILFTIYMTSLGHLLRHHNVEYHCYADDTQIWMPFEPHRLDDTIHRMELCLADVQRWMAHFKLKMNNSKTELLIIANPRLAKEHDFNRIISLDGVEISPSKKAVRNLGVQMKADMSLNEQVSLISRACFAQIKNIQRIKKFLDKKTLAMVIHSFVTSRMDYCNSLLLGAPAYLIKKMQRIQNAAARLLTDTAVYEHITPVLRDLHWLTVHKRIMFKVLLIVFRVLHDCAPTYLNVFSERTSTDNRRSLRFYTCYNLNVPFTSSNLVFNRSFTVAAPRLWNSLPPSIKHAPDIIVFKKLLKTHLFNLDV